MKRTYPIFLVIESGGAIAYIPDFDVTVQADDVTSAIEAARDAISIRGIEMEDGSVPVPAPSDIQSLKATAGEIISLVDVDFKGYRAKMETKTVRKNCSLPMWLCHEAEKRKINFSEILKNALLKEIDK